MSMSDAQDLQLGTQRELVRHALRSWIHYRDESVNPNLISGLMNGDVLWIDDQKHFWVGVTMTWAFRGAAFPIIEHGEMLVTPPTPEIVEGTRVQTVFMRVFDELAQFDAYTEAATPVGMRGLRYAGDFNEVRDYYEKV